MMEKEFLTYAENNPILMEIHKKIMGKKGE